MRTVQLMKKKIKNIFRVYHIRIIAKKIIGSHDMLQTDSSIIIVRNVCVLTKHPWLFNFYTQGRDHHNNGEDDKHAHGFADF